MDLLLRITEVLFHSPVALCEVKRALQQDEFKNSRVVAWVMRAVVSEVCIQQSALD